MCGFNKASSSNAPQASSFAMIFCISSTIPVNTSLRQDSRYLGLNYSWERVKRAILRKVDFPQPEGASRCLVEEYPGWKSIHTKKRNFRYPPRTFPVFTEASRDLFIALCGKSLLRRLAPLLPGRHWRSRKMTVDKSEMDAQRNLLFARSSASRVKKP